MVSYKKKESGKWQYTISRMINGKSQPIRKGGFNTKLEAEVAASEIQSKLAKGLSPALKKIPFYDYFENWIELYKKNKVSATTFTHYMYSLKAVQQYFTAIPIQDIKRSDYQLFLNQLGANKAKETVAKINGHIKACVKDAIEDQIIHNDFTRKTNLFWANKAKTGEEKHLNFVDSQKLLKALYNKRNDGLGYSLLLLAATSGMRYGELIGLTKKDFDFEKNRITINKTWAYKKVTGAGFAPTKNEQSKRIIKMDTVTMQHFSELFKTIPTNINELVFYSPESRYKVISNTTTNKLLRKTLLELDIEPITVHGLRHTHASVLLYQNTSIHYISERLGHGDIETTLKEYTHVLKELRLKDEKTLTNLFEQIFS